MPTQVPNKVPTQLPTQLPTQQTQNRCGIQPDVTGGYIMVAGWARDAKVTLSPPDSMG